jgi:YgiT-type zinc finger domain-containing protein
MHCLTCKQGEIREGLASVTFVRGVTTLVFKNVPAQICNNCGEEYFSDDVSRSLLQQAEVAAEAGVEIDVRQYLAA